MHRDQYLGKTSNANAGHVVRDFVVWLAANLRHPTLFAHQYTDRRTGDQWQFSGLEDACVQYHWKHKGALGSPAGTSLSSNDAALTALGKALQDGIGKADDVEALAASSGVMKWGGVSAGNVRWLTINSNGLAALLKSTAAAFASGNLAEPILLNANLRFNAGMTKVYSLLVQDFIIYDSRVAAALGWIVVKYCEAMKLTQVPAELAFAWAPAKEAPGAKSPKNRNPGRDDFFFPRLTNAVQHAEWNLKASWILAEALTLAGAENFAGFTSVAPLRRLESALFMIGYDLPQNGGCVAQVETRREPSTVVTHDMIECFTAVKRNQFFYRIDKGGILMGKGRRHSIEEINTVLTTLWKAFDSKPFPLANSATKVRDGQERFGIGMAYYAATHNKGNPPDSSALAAVLQDLGALSYTPGGKDNWSINTSELSIAADGDTIDISTLIDREIELRDML
ncbi:hypothetical protein [Pseudomonas sp. KK4]|uniref:hypothetical protein n=1 Tax=Pseudomonas sp. KK4 TaxID=1855729 RepID=UPI00097BF862|nr:hypothetical protein [Pseudomonas sp. KK4]